jgi:TonB family protein
MKRLAMLVAVSFAGAVLLAQDDALKAARDLYASAAYEEALSALTRVGSSAPDAAAAREMDAYRAFCLVALGRTAEAERIAESLIRKDPMLTLDQYRDTSPRIAAMFAAVRTRVLPQVIRDEYRTARALASTKSPDAESRLTHVLQMLGEAQKIGVWDDTLADVRVLVEGFLDLSRASRPGFSAGAATPATGTIEPASADGVSAAAPTASRAGDAGVVAPVALSQPAPHVPPGLLDLVKRLRRTGTIDVVINEHGIVEDVIVKQSVNAAYDALVVAAARTWKYRPAMKNGVPVRFVKTVVINVKEQ